MITSAPAATESSWIARPTACASRFASPHHASWSIGTPRASSSVPIPPSMTIGIAGSYAAILDAMAAPDRRKRSRSQRIRDALVWGTIAGGAGGAALGAGIDGLGAAPGALIGAVLSGRGGAIAAARHGPAEPKPLAGRIAASAVLMALFG